MPIVRYIVGDIDASLPFYLALGFAVEKRMGPPFAILERDGLKMWLSGPASSAARTLPDGSVPGPGGWNRIVVEVPDLTAAMAALRPTGARFRSDPVVGPGGSQVVIEDPSGNPIELFQARGE